ncbi:MAG: hypothetical protein ACREOF_14035 [Gemmatimonadales bacterium]
MTDWERFKRLAVIALEGAFDSEYAATPRDIEVILQCIAIVECLPPPRAEPGISPCACCS